MTSLIKYLKPYRKEAVLAPLFKLLEASFELLVPLVMARIIDIGIAQGNRSYVYSMGLVLVLFGVTGLVSAITAQYFSAKAAAGFGTALRNDLFRHIMGLSHDETDAFGSATLITRITNDTNQIQNGVNMFFRLVLRSPFIVFGAMIMAFLISGKAGLLFLTVISVLFLIVFLIMKSTVRMYRIVQKKLDRILSDTSENLAGVRVLRAFNRQEHEKEIYRVGTGELAHEQIKTGNVSALLNPFTYIVVNLGIIAVLQTGAVSVSVGSLTQGQVVALVNYMSQILLELIKFANLIILLSKSSACAKRVNEIFGCRNSMRDGTLAMDENPEEGIPAVEFADVGFSYPGAQEEAVSNLNFSVKKGETVGIIGGTGSGKTTVVSLIPRFYDAQRGKILINGHDVREYTLDSLRRHVGIVEQGAGLFKGTISSNLRWGKRDADQEELIQAIHTAQADNVTDESRGGLDAPVAQKGRNYSGGQKQRLSIARTLVRKPDILILDDSSSALDFATDAALRRSIRETSSDITVFLVSQRVSTIRRADKILVLDDGRIAGCGTHDELIKCCGIYREICLSQLPKEEVGL